MAGSKGGSKGSKVRAVTFQAITSAIVKVGRLYQSHSMVCSSIMFIRNQRIYKTVYWINQCALHLFHSVLVGIRTYGVVGIEIPIHSTNT